MLFLACNPTTQVDNEVQEWIAISDIDGNNLQYVCRHYGEDLYFVPDLDNPGEEIILLDCSVRIDVMNLDGTNRHTIIDSLGSIANFSADRTKMLLREDGEIYMVNVDGTDLVNLTKTPEIGEYYAAFTKNCEKVVFSRKEDDKASIAVLNLSTSYLEVVYEFNINADRYNVFGIERPTFIDENKIIFNLSVFYADDNQEDFTKLQIIDLNSGNIDLIYENSIISTFFYDHNNNLAFIDTESDLLFDISNLVVNYEFNNSGTLGIDIIDVFSETGRYAYWRWNLFDIKFQYMIDTNMKISDINKQETNLIGIYSRKYGE